jgi:uncharacterized damage-inducible protein DinB
MTELLPAQYALVQGARGALLDYCATLAPAHFTAPVPAFPNGSIRDLLVHVAGAYQHWLDRVARQSPVPRPEPAQVPDVAALRALFAATDRVVADFGRHFAGQWQQPLDFVVPGRPAPLRLTPLALFTHVVTHEFHHKGQVLALDRLLGYPPPDTDVIRF